MMREEQPADMNKLIKKMKRIHLRIATGYYMGKFDKALKYIEQEEELIKQFQGDLPEEIKGIHIVWLFYRGNIYAWRGNLALCFKDANDLLTIAQLYGYKRGISDGTYVLGIYYWFSGDLDKALVHFDRAIRLSEENLNDLMDFIMLASQLNAATWVSIEKEDLKRAKKYCRRLEEIKELKPEEVTINAPYRMAKACLLKSSMRSRDRVMAEDLFREIIEEDLAVFIYRLHALSELCELLLVELRFSNDINIIGEIKPLLENLIGMAQHSGIYYFLIEAYILHGKLALIMFDIESSRRYLTQARRMAERYGYIGLADEIAGLHEAMIEKLDTWEQLEKKDAPLSERMELARLEDHLKGKFRTRMMKMERITEGEVPVYKGSKMCLVCKGSAEGFNVYVCPECNSFYCKACAQAVINLENQCWTCNSPIDTSKLVKYDVFISYSNKDKEVADAVCHFLEQQGITCWIAPRDVTTGSYASAIVDAIKNSKLMVLIFTNNANFSKHVKRELELSVKNDVTIQPIRTEDVEPISELEYYISSMHWLDALTPPLEEHLSKLAQKVSQLLKVL